jgi:hypothetical protein
LMNSSHYLANLPDRCTSASLRRYPTFLIKSFPELDTVVAGAEICRSFDFETSEFTSPESTYRESLPM